MKRLIKKLLSESIIYEVIDSLLDEDYPSNWNVEEFKSLTSFNARMKYCQDNLQRISSGSGRIVYMIDNEKVLKLARNKKGVAQNEVEVQYSREHMLEDIVATIFNAEPNDLWVEMELARKLTTKSFKQLVGVSFELFAQAVSNYGSDANGDNRGGGRYNIPQETVDELWENEFIYGIFQLIGNYGIPAGDLMKTSSYGIVKRNGEDIVVMIDYGLTSEVYDSYYS